MAAQTLQGKTVLEYIPLNTTSPPTLVQVVKELRATLGLSLEQSLALARPVHGNGGEVVVFEGDLMKAGKFADRLVACGCAAKTVLVNPSQPHPVHTTADWLKDFKDRNSDILDGNEQAAFRVVIDTLEEFGDSNYE
jgi:hypothetical protein